MFLAKKCQKCNSSCELVFSLFKISQKKRSNQSFSHWTSLLTKFFHLAFLYFLLKNLKLIYCSNIFWELMLDFLTDFVVFFHTFIDLSFGSTHTYILSSWMVLKRYLTLISDSTQTQTLGPNYGTSTHTRAHTHSGTFVQTHSHTQTWIWWLVFVQRCIDITLGFSALLSNHVEQNLCLMLISYSLLLIIHFFLAD